MRCFLRVGTIRPDPLQVRALSELRKSLVTLTYTSISCLLRSISALALAFGPLQTQHRRARVELHAGRAAGLREQPDVQRDLGAVVAAGGAVAAGRRPQSD